MSAIVSSDPTPSTGRDDARAEEFWRAALTGVAAPTLLPLRRPEAAGGGREEGVDALAPERSRSLAVFAAESGISIATLAEGAWALVLSRWSGSDDVVFAA
ncbi:MAG TPA: hypothetical protein VG777_04335, partial [Thermoanaerobaculia bacterium]|nr:hypothetical protein [Thermoanaerobaculia bacterium]